MIKNRFCMVSLSLIFVVMLTILPAFATSEIVNDVSNDGLIVYTDGYEPGMFAEFTEPISLFSAVSYGSFAMSGITPWVTLTDISSVYLFENDGFSVTTATTDDGKLRVIANQQQPSFAATTGGLFGVRYDDNAYFDFQHSGLTFTQESSDSDTFIVNGTLTFQAYLKGLITLNSGTTVTRYAPFIPVGIQFLVDGAPVGDVISVDYDTTDSTTMTSWTSTVQPSAESIAFADYKIYDIDSRPELIGVRVYVELVGSNTGSFAFSTSNTVATIDYTVWAGINPLALSIDYVDTSAGVDYSVDLSAISGILTSIYTQLVTANSSLSSVISGIDDMITAQGTGNSYLSSAVNYLKSTVSYLGSISSELTATKGVLSNVYTRLGNMLDVLTDSKAIQSDTLTAVGEFDDNVTALLTASDGTEWFSYVNNNLILLYRYFANASFSWTPFDMSIGSLSGSASATGQNEFMQDAFQSIEDKLGRLAFVFASDDDIELKLEADPASDAFRDTFGGGASASDIIEISSTVGEVQVMFDSGFSVADLWQSLSGESWRSWFTSENAQALDSTGSPAAIDDEDPFNMQTYYDHLQAVEEIRSREED